MSSRKVIQVFEYDTIRQDQVYDGVKFEEKELEAIQRYNTKNQNKHFTLTHKGVKFNSYVGVIQIGNLTIEILPKADKNLNKNIDADKKQAWKDFLLQMLRKSGLINITSLTRADLKIRNASLLDIYIQEFLNETEDVLRKGLSKKYHFKQNNVSSLKGRLIFGQHITKNLIHKERFFTTHQVYDWDHPLNQILLKALLVLKTTTINPIFLDKISRITNLFPEVKNIKVTENTFSKIQLYRNTEHYRRSIGLAKLILLNYSPDIQSGANDVIAILFDMNQLWERYIYRLLQKDEKEGQYNVSYQNSKKFWNNKTIKPDIVLDKNDQKYIIDTKWKLIDINKPGDNDLKQMFAYNLYWKANKSMLLYPQAANQSVNDFGKFHVGIHDESSEDNLCKLGFLKIWREKSEKIELRRSIYKEVFSQLNI